MRPKISQSIVLWNLEIIYGVHNSPAANLVPIVPPHCQILFNTESYPSFYALCIRSDPLTSIFPNQNLHRCQILTIYPNNFQLVDMARVVLTSLISILDGFTLSHLTFEKTTIYTR